jgi:hypothetical protein
MHDSAPPEPESRPDRPVRNCTSVSLGLVATANACTRTPLAPETSRGHVEQASDLHIVDEGVTRPPRGAPSWSCRLHTHPPAPPHPRLLRLAAMSCQSREVGTHVQVRCQVPVGAIPPTNGSADDRRLPTPMVADMRALLCSACVTGSTRGEAVPRNRFRTPRQRTSRALAPMPNQVVRTTNPDRGVSPDERPENLETSCKCR